jgi:hypothetical protein
VLLPGRLGGRFGTIHRPQIVADRSGSRKNSWSAHSEFSRIPLRFHRRGCEPLEFAADLTAIGIRQAGTLN